MSLEFSRKRGARRRVVRRFGAGALVVCSWLGSCLAAGCAESPADRFEAQREIGHVTIPGTALEIWVEPGADPATDVSRANLRVHASAPTPRLTIDYGATEPSGFRLVLQNVFPGARVFPTVSALDAARHPACADLADGQRRVDAPVIAPEQEDDQPMDAVSFQLPLRPCTRTVLEVRPPPRLSAESGGVLRLAVIGEIRGNADVLEDALDDMAAWPADLIVALGSLANSAERADLVAWRDLVQSREIPFVVAIGRDEARGGGLLPFHDVFGRSDYSFAVGDVRLMIVDTASSELSDAQFEYWERQLQSFDERVVLAFMQVPPFDVAGVRNAGFRNRDQAGRFVTLLGENGVDVAFAGGSASYLRRELGRIPFHITGGGGAPMEPSAPVGHHYLRVEVGLQQRVDPDTGRVSDPLNVEVREL